MGDMAEYRMNTLHGLNHGRPYILLEILRKLSIHIVSFSSGFYQYFARGCARVREEIWRKVLCGCLFLKLYFGNSTAGLLSRLFIVSTIDEIIAGTLIELAH